jgi:hypothetical protein
MTLEKNRFRVEHGMTMEESHPESRCNRDEGSRLWGNGILRACGTQNDSGDERHPEYLDFIGGEGSRLWGNWILRACGTQNDMGAN